MDKKKITVLALLLFIVIISYIALNTVLKNKASEKEGNLTGPYLGQELPGDDPVLFAPGIISTKLANRDVAMTPDGKEMYFGVNAGAWSFSTIIVCKNVDGVWTEPVVADFASDPKFKYFEPAISPDGSKFMYCTNQPEESEEPLEHPNVWVMDREGDSWVNPRPVSPEINSENSEFFPSITRDGTVYFFREVAPRDERAMRSRLVNGEYQPVEELPENVNCGRARYNGFIDPDEKYFIYCIFGLEDTVGSTDYYVAFRNDDDTWTDPVNMGDKVNTIGGLEHSPYISPDGKYFFFMSTRIPERELPEKMSMEWLIDFQDSPENGLSDIYWVKADFIENLRPE